MSEWGDMFGQIDEEIKDEFLTKTINTIKEFDWGNYGLDDLDPGVNPDLADDWAIELATKIWEANQR